MGTRVTSVVVILLLFALVFIELGVGVGLQISRDDHQSNVSCTEGELKALFKLRESLVDHSNRCLPSWVGEYCCTWTGVGCSKRTRRVVKLDLHNPIPLDLYLYFTDSNYIKKYDAARLQGEISPSILNLRHLHYIDLSFNNFPGTQIPEFLGSLKNLRYLDLSFSNFVGQIPPQFGNLSNLQHLNLGLNYLQGPIPDTLGRMSSLTFLDLGDTRYSDSPIMPSWLCEMSSLVHLGLQYISYRGPILPCLWNLTSLTVLDLSWNSFEGSVPSEIGNLTQLTVLDLSDNNLEGEIPNTIRNLCSLSSFHLSHNKFTGEVPFFQGNTSTCLQKSLKELHLHSNKFSGFLPNQLGEFRMLEVFDISDNSFDGIISEIHFAKLTRLVRLDMSSNLLIMNVSIQWVPRFQLQFIHMSSCKLGPQFPPWLQTQKLVEELVISNASISDTIPNWFEDLYSGIHGLDISYNQICGKLPKFQESNAIYGRYLYLNSNKFEGPLTPFLSDVTELDLADNLLSGHFPLGDDNIHLNFRVLFISNNSLTGNIPKYICKAMDMRVLDLSTNKLSGTLPWCMGDLDQLAVLDLTNNYLDGHIPSSLGSLRLLESLHLRNNKLHGKIPSLQNSTYLNVLDLGDNELTDIIPSWIGEMSFLQFLTLRSNKFHGYISPQLCHLSALQVLDLSHNYISGNIPRCFANFTTMVANPNAEHTEKWYPQYQESILNYIKGVEVEYTKTRAFLTSIDVSNNQIVGEIPEELMDLIGLRNFNASKNHLSGRIPKKIGNMTALESLDLSTNKLSGSIPPSLSALNFLSYLNLSFNNLSGPIPTGNQLQTLNDPSIYMGNNQLCGSQIFKSCPGDTSSDGHHHDQHVPESEERLAFYTAIGPGFLVGFLGICGILHFKKSWRYAWFQFVENTFNNLLVAVAVKVAWVQRKFHKDEMGG
ncbi:receptor-like protein EIX2 [Cornus florida]|uniref:receptor-like protein EIX2 n=1 Tax=Cornus florida TaxID=4283 RepID=UPI002896E074|nr:receptor-like protein EIX2 [Cornus florida]